MLIIIFCGETLNTVNITSLAQKTENNIENSNAQSMEISATMLQYIIPAVIAAVASAAAAIIAAWNQTKLKKLEEAKAEQDARRDYEYDARKRLYHELEPIIFLHVEDSDNAYDHIMELAKMARSGILSENLKMAEDNNQDNYYLKATVYKLIRPMAVFRLMQQHLTTYDLQLEDYFRLQYTLAKCLYFSCTDDYYIALGGREKEDDKICLICAFQGALKRHEEKNRPTSHPNHIVYNILGMTRGIMDNLADSLIKFDENDKIYRIRTFGQFEEQNFGLQNSNIAPSMKTICELFLNMNPNRRDTYPNYVLIWRILVLHACIYSIMKKIILEKQSYQPYFTGNDTSNTIDRVKIRKHMVDFFKEEKDKFRWVVDDEKNHNSQITKERMEKDWSNSLSAIGKYLDDWLRRNYENPVRPTKMKRKFIFNLSNVRITNKHQ